MTFDLSCPGLPSARAVESGHLARLVKLALSAPEHGGAYMADLYLQYAWHGHCRRSGR